MRQIKIGFRVDTGNIVGAGHLMEVIAIYKNLTKRFDLNPMFITVENDYVIPKLRQVGIERIYPIANNTIAEELTENDDIDMTISILKKNQYEHLIVDLPNRTQSYYKMLSENTKGTYAILDNDAHKQITSALAINFSISQDVNFYDGFQDREKYLIGPKYIPLNESILEYKPIEIKDNVERIFLNQGGSDPHGITAKVIRSLEKLAGNYTIDVLIGGLLNPYNKKQLKDALQSSTKHKYNLYENITQQSVYEQMEKADIAITAAGNTLYELAYFGIPSIMIAPRVEFLKITESFEKLGFNVNLGLNDDINEDLIKTKTEYLIENYDLRQKISSSLKRLVDGKGTVRICDHICEYVMVDN